MTFTVKFEIPNEHFNLDDFVSTIEWVYPDMQICFINSTRTADYEQDEHSLNTVD